MPLIEIQCPSCRKINSAEYAPASLSSEFPNSTSIFPCKRCGNELGPLLAISRALSGLEFQATRAFHAGLLESVLACAEEARLLGYSKEKYRDISRIAFMACLRSQSLKDRDKQLIYWLKEAEFLRPSSCP